MRQSYLNILYYVIEYMCIYIRVIKLPVIMLNVRAVSGMALRPICRRPLTAYEGVLHFNAISKIMQVFSCYMHRTFFHGYDSYTVKLMNLQIHRQVYILKDRLPETCNLGENV